MTTVALLEDEDILRQLMGAELRRSGFEVVSAADGESGWKLIQKCRPALILLDLLMPRLSGYDVLARLRADSRLAQTPCIVISNSGQADDLNRAYSCGADDVLIKASFNPDQLVAKVLELLAKRAGPASA